MAAIVDYGMKSRRATAIRVVSFAGTKGNAYFGDREDRKLKCKCRGGDGGKSKKQKGSRDGDHCGQKLIKPRDATSGDPDVDLHAGYNALDAYHLMSQKQQGAALAFCKVHKEYKNGAVVESLAVAAEPKNTGCQMTQRLLQPSQTKYMLHHVGARMPPATT
jgi:hypothetical protein